LRREAERELSRLAAINSASPEYAAGRLGLKGVILPRRNERDLADVPPQVRERLQWKLVDRVDQVLEVALRPRRDVAAA
jgi:ATP-dependent Lon protease